MDPQRGNLTLVVFAGLLVAALLLVPMSGALLPPIVASHFNASGMATASMPRGTYVALMAACAVGVPLVMVASIAWRVGRAPERLKIPNRAHWLAPERREETAAYINLHTTRFASILMVFLVFVHVLVVRANLLRPPHLELWPMLGSLALFIAATAAWLLALRARFAKV